MIYQFRLGSVTNAQRAKKVLLQKGIHAYMLRIAAPSKEDGCGYAVRVQCSEPAYITELLSDAGIRVIGVDRE